MTGSLEFQWTAQIPKELQALLIAEAEGKSIHLDGPDLGVPPGWYRIESLIYRVHDGMGTASVTMKPVTA